MRLAVLPALACLLVLGAAAPAVAQVRRPAPGGTIGSDPLIPAPPGRPGAASFTAIGPVPVEGELVQPWPVDVSGDGRVALMNSDTGALVWRRGLPVQPLVGLPPVSPPSSLHFNALSADGEVVVGLLEPGVVGTPYHVTPFHWSLFPGFAWLPMQDFRPQAASADGSVVVGSLIDPLTYLPAMAMQWSADHGFVVLGGTSATDVSNDGTVVVGRSGPEAFRWTAGLAAVGLGDLPGGGFASWANAVSPDGSVVVGASDSDLGTAAFRWSAETGMQSLGVNLEQGCYRRISWGVATSERGRLVLVDTRLEFGPWVGDAPDLDCSVFPPFVRAAIWDAAHGLRSLFDVLAEDFGLSEVGDWREATAVALADDGRTIVGVGIAGDGTRQAWIAEIPRIDVALEVAPGSRRDPPVLHRSGTVSLALLGSPGVDVRDIDPESLHFGPPSAPTPLPRSPRTPRFGRRRFTWYALRGQPDTGGLLSVGGRTFARRVDVDRDGQPDLLLLALPGWSELAPGDTRACVDGEIAGEPFRACDEVLVR